MAAHALPAPMARAMARMALAALGLSGNPVHESVHARDTQCRILLLCVNVADAHGSALASGQGARDCRLTYIPLRTQSGQPTPGSAEMSALPAHALMHSCA